MWFVKCTTFFNYFFLFKIVGCRIENCDSCFSKDFCTKCKVGFYLHRGRCFDECPDGFAPLDETMECVGEYVLIQLSNWIFFYFVKYIFCIKRRKEKYAIILFVNTTLPLLRKLWIFYGNIFEVIYGVPVFNFNFFYTFFKIFFEGEAVLRQCFSV